jgi:hypothetical protein
MMKLALLVPVAALSAACMMPPGFGQTGGAAQPSSGSGSSGSPSSGATQAAAESSPASPSAPVPTSVELHNDCANTVPLFLGSGDGKPGFSSGTKTSIESNSTESFPRNPDGTVTIWIIDNSENGITSLKVTPDITKVSVNCSTLTPGG